MTTEPNPVNTPTPNTVPPSAAEAARAFIFERRQEPGIAPVDIVAHLIAGGHGSEFSTPLKSKRLKKWALQVLRRLGRNGWLDAPEGGGEWTSTAALRDCGEPDVLGRRVSRRPQPVTPVSPRPDSWEEYIETWIFRHRDSGFLVGEIAVAMVQRNYGTGRIDDRLEGAREQAEVMIRSLAYDGLLTYDAPSEKWEPTETLRTWPSADDS